jgi:hypothetical protein
MGDRGFHQRAARWIAEHGVRQFIDIGAGLPTTGNTHEVVQKVDAAHDVGRARPRVDDVVAQRPRTAALVTAAR